MDDAARHLRVKALFLVACDLPDEAAQRAALHAQGADAATVAEVMTLLGHADGPTHFSTPLAQAAQALDDELQEGDVLGAWTLQGTLGQGGMGRVFGAARSDGHYTQRAALKLLREQLPQPLPPLEPFSIEPTCGSKGGEHDGQKETEEAEADEESPAVPGG